MTSSSSSSSSQLFASYRSLGFVCDEVPVHVKKLGTETFITTSVGKGWQVYNADKLRLVMVGPYNATSRIRALTSVRDRTYTTHGARIVVHKRSDHETDLVAHETDVYLFTHLSHYLLSVDEAQTLCVWDTRTHSLFSTLQFGCDRRITCLLHPHTYLNKVVVGFSDGGMELWNVRSRSLVYKFDTSVWRGKTSLATLLGVAAAASDDGSASAITCIEHGPAIDVVAVGLANGGVVVYNLKAAKVIMEFCQREGTVTALAFRSDGVEHTLVSGTTVGTINIWNLETGQLLHAVQQAHEAAVTSLHFLAQEPVLITAGHDNALKQWIFDQSDHTCRVLKSRVGHSAPPRRIRFYATVDSETASINTCSVLSAGDDRSLRMFSVLRDQHSHELSQGSTFEKRAHARGVSAASLKLSPIVGFDACETRRRDWSNIVTCHVGDRAAHAWSFQKRALTKVKLVGGGNKKQKSTAPNTASASAAAANSSAVHSSGSEATAVCMSACGNFSVVGNDTGDVSVYNIQSGLLRGRCLCSAEEIQEVSTLSTTTTTTVGDSNGSSSSSSSSDTAMIQQRQQKKRKRKRDLLAHSDRVIGVAVDAVNSQLVSASLDRSVRFWSFNTHQLLHVAQMESEVCQIELHKGSGLLAVATEDWQITLFDIETHRVVRHFRGHQHRVTDMAFSPDSRWLVSACLDGSVRVFDIPTGRMIDWFAFDKPVTSLCFSPQGDFLATAHANSVGIFLWANRSYFSTVYFKSAPSAPINLDLAETHDLSVINGSSTQVDDDEKMTANNDSEAERKRSDDLFGVVTFAPRPLLHATAHNNNSNTGSAESELITMSELPKSKWHNLAMLDVIKERNKPIQPARAPPQAPFFLPTTAEVNAELDVSGGMMADDGTMPTNVVETNMSSYSSRILKSRMERTMTPLLKLLQAAVGVTKVDTATMIYLKGLSPSAVDAEIRSLATDPVYECEEIGLLLDFLTQQFESRNNFEFLQSLLHLVLNVHADIIAMYPELRAKLPHLMQVQQESWQRLDSLLQSNLCLVSHFTKTQT